MTVAELIKSARAERGLNQRDLAAALGVRQQTVSRWESGTACPLPRRLASVIDALGLDKTQALRSVGLLEEGEEVVRRGGAA